MIKWFFLALLSINIFYLSTHPTKADFAVPSVEATVDRGLFLEIMLKCEEVFSGQHSSSIMSFSKTEKKFCSANWICFDNARAAAIQSCNSDELVSDKKDDGAQIQTPKAHKR